MRTRITAAVAALVVAAQIATGVLIYAVEARRIDQAVHSSVDQELSELVRFQSDGKDPETGEPFTSSERLLRVFLERNLPGQDEVLIGWVGRVQYISAGSNASLTRDPTVLEAIPELVRSGSQATVESPRYGTVLLTVQPISVDGNQDDGLVVAVLMDEARAELRDLMRTYILVALLSLGIIVAVASRVAGSLLRPIRGLNAAARRISATDLSARLPVQGNDDITALTVTTNEMLARLEEAFTAQRDFLDDAGHELKTPLTVLRGHLELMDGEDPAETRETRDLLLDEVDRMSRLVQDLILLTKSRRPDFVVRAEVDLADLTQNVFAKFQGLGDRAWVLDDVAHETAHLDEQRITQALLQLADNAVKHTDPGGEIGLGSEVTDDEVRLWVRDSGDGIPAEVRDTVVQRFGRGTVREGDEGFGLGLSIVSAIAEAHEGSLVLDDSTDSSARTIGAWVELRLPRGGRTWHRS
ncbi:MAG: sensor histidine kinase [Nocardioides sp.]|uniref:sensor histidine kinase n=1 Tax=Nocardioides sp. TaxID=35761 RepID=UPI003EFEED9F